MKGHIREKYHCFNPIFIKNININELKESCESFYSNFVKEILNEEIGEL